MTDPGRTAALLARFVERHPALAGLAQEPDLAVLAFTPHAWLLLEGPQQAHRWQTGES
jgi:hypothetical protein